MLKLSLIISQLVLLCSVQIVGGQTSSRLDSLYAIGEYDQAIEVYQNSTTSNGFKTHLSLAKIYLAKQNYEQALLYYKKALTVNANPRHRFAYAQLLLKQDQYKNADSVLTQLHIDFPKNAEFVYQLGMSKKPSQAKTLDQYFKKAIELNPKHLRAYYELARFYTKIKSYKQAILVCGIALKLDPNHKKITGHLGQVLFNDKQYKKALDYFQRLDKHHGVPQFILEKMGYSAWYSQELKLSKSYYLRLLQLEPKNHVYHQNISKVFNALGEHKKAISHAASALRYKDVSTYKATYELGVGYLGESKYKLAMQQFELVIKEEPSYELAYVKLARAADEFFKDKSKVLPYFIRYQDYFDELETARYKDFMYRRLKDIRQALHFNKAK